MSITIGSLAGLFTGYKYIPGPLSVDFKQKHIDNICHEADTSPDIDGTGKIMIPPFTDGHTHAVFAGERFTELGLKLQGVSYSEILAQGGGIQKTVQATREASTEELLELLMGRLDVMLTHGSLNVEVKSGYGLTAEHELRLLKVIQQANELHPVDVTATFGGAHVVPQDKARKEYIQEIIDEMLPQVRQKGLATSTDVFCDQGAFTVEETRTIFDASTQLGIPVRVHAEELAYTGIGKIAAAEYKALSADHLLLARQSDFEVLAEHNTVAMFMPLAPLGLFTTDRPQNYLDSEVTIGLGSDFNPNNWVTSMQTAIRMAVFLYQMPPLLALQAATSGSYLGVTGKQLDPLTIGSPADCLLLQASSVDEVATKLDQNLVSHIFKAGTLVHKSDRKIA